MCPARCFNGFFLFISAALLIVLVSLGVASANTNTVTNTNDSGPGSLRQAILGASSGDTIDITATGTVVLQSPLPQIEENLTITGPGASKLTVSGDNKYQVFIIFSGTVNISGLTVSNGYTMGSRTPTSGNNLATISLPGGGIFNMGTLTVTNCTFSDNSAGTDLPGGGIYNVGSLEVTNCTFSGNSATDGGGIFNGGGAVLNAISGNNPTDTYTPSIGSTGSGTLTVTNCTFSGNSATDGGGIYNAGTSTITNCTLSDNTATTGGGIYNGALAVASVSGDNLAAPSVAAPTLGVENTIVANNSGGNCAGTVLITSNGYNLEYGDNPATCNFTQSTDHHANPELAPLALNSPGTTETFALLPGSPAIDAADPDNFPPTDERGVIRPQGAGPDIGAYEYAPPAPVPAMDGWGIIVFIILAGLGSVYYLRRRGRAEG
jgi:predicted outer membrane repeat protein